MATHNFHRPHLSMPHFATPHLRRNPADPIHHHHHRPAYQAMRRIERGMDLVIVGLVVLLAVAMIYGLLTATGHPAYFDRYWVTVWRHTSV